MGKLLQKLVNGIVPSWLTKINKSSANASPKKLLTLSKASTHVSPSSSTRNNPAVLPLIACDITDQGIEDEAELSSKACAESSVVLVSPSSAKLGMTASMKQKAHKNNENHQQQQQQQQHQDHNGPHHPHHVDKITYSNQGMPHEHGTNICAPSPEMPSSRKHEHDHHPQQHYGNCNNGLGLEKRDKCMPEADKARSGRRALADHFYQEFLELDGEVNVRMQEDNHRGDHDNKPSHEAEIGYDQNYKNGYHDLLGLKRKSQYLQEEEEEEGGGSHGSGNIDATGWGWKRRKGEKGVMSCELPESICSIVGNGKAVVKHSRDPHMALWESMVEMIVGNGIWELGNLEFLLFCYLSLNEPHLHPIIQSSFLQVLKDLEKTEC